MKGSPRLKWLTLLLYVATGMLIAHTALGGGFKGFPGFSILNPPFTTFHNLPGTVYYAYCLAGLFVTYVFEGKMRGMAMLTGLIVPVAHLLFVVQSDIEQTVDMVITSMFLLRLVHSTLIKREG